MTRAPMLAGIRVVEAASGVAGPMAACRLGDLGADVVKVEWGDGDWMRGCPPFLAGSSTSAVFFALNRGKRALCARRAPRRRDRLLRRLLERADVFITDRNAAALTAARARRASTTIPARGIRS